MSTKKISRRDFLKAAGISAAAIGLTACGGSSSTAAAIPIRASLCRRTGACRSCSQSLFRISRNQGVTH